LANPRCVCQDAMPCVCSCERPGETPRAGQQSHRPWPRATSTSRPQRRRASVPSPVTTSLSSLPLVEEAPGKVKAGLDPEKWLIYLWRVRDFAAAALRARRGAWEGAWEGFQHGRVCLITYHR